MRFQCGCGDCSVDSGNARAVMVKHKLEATVPKEDKKTALFASWPALDVQEITSFVKVTKIAIITNKINHRLTQERLARPFLFKYIEGP